MNSYELSRNFWNWAFDNPEKVKPIHSAVYFFAIEHCNRLGWKQKFGFPSQMVMEAIGVKNWRTYSKALSDLVDWGFFKMVETSKNQYSANIIAIVKNTKAQYKALDKALSKHSTKHSQSTVSIDKQLNNKTRNNKTIEQYSREVFQTYEEVIIYFPESLHPKNEKIKTNWLKTIDQLNRIDKLPFELISDIVKKTREDDFWSTNFLSVPKLRKKNKDGVPYFMVFFEKFIKIKNNAKNHGHNTKGTTEEELAEVLKRHFEAQKNGESF